MSRNGNVCFCLPPSAQSVSNPCVSFPRPWSPVRLQCTLCFQGSAEVASDFELQNWGKAIDLIADISAFVSMFAWNKVPRVKRNCALCSIQTAIHDAA